MERSETPKNQPKRWVAWCVHLYTATGVLWALLALDSIFDERYPAAYFWMGVAMFVDASDGPLARRFCVSDVLPEIDGALLDNIVDYLTWTFVPIILLWQSDWLLEPAWLWCCMALVGSVFAFVHRDAKVTNEGFFRGFPSYWNVFAFYVDIAYRTLGPGFQGWGPWIVSVMVAVLSVMSVMPIYFAYPNRIKSHRGFFVGGGMVWSLICLAMVALWPDVPLWLFLVSLIYPIGYTILSIRLSASLRQ